MESCLSGLRCQGPKATSWGQDGEALRRVGRLAVSAGPAASRGALPSRAVRTKGARCPLRANCTIASPDAGRTVSIARDDRLQHIACETSSPLPRAANAYANESPSSIVSHAWAASRGRALATLVFGKPVRRPAARPPS
jgi:hypothetical protein